MPSAWTAGCGNRASAPSASNGWMGPALRHLAVRLAALQPHPSGAGQAGRAGHAAGEDTGNLAAVLWWQGVVAGQSTRWNSQMPWRMATRSWHAPLLPSGAGLLRIGSAAVHSQRALVKAACRRKSGCYRAVYSHLMRTPPYSHLM
mmetsp:Transcript_48414/g.140245  ORF Transcript_48414/g.140245 Transcript_48414/m.140245 type:complete len:146 (+) Transcript_48414:606-1043(+)